MTETIDQLLIKIVGDKEVPLDELIPKRDAKVLKSLAATASSPKFITENQGKLLVKILTENSKKIPNFSEKIEEVIPTGFWSKTFRPIDKTKKMYIDYTTIENPRLVIEFAFNSQIRKILHGNSKKILGLVQEQAGKKYVADLTEKNIVELVDLLSSAGFDIDEKIQDFYNTIKSWSKNEVKSQFFLENISHTTFQKLIVEDFGDDQTIDDNIAFDRSVRYQYFLEKPEKSPENLVDVIANRTSSKIWINKKEHGLDVVIESLLKLRRLPLLVIFDANDQKRCFEDLKNLSENLEKNGIFQDIGIYFRLPNTEDGIEFNRLIAEKQYNCQLDENTKIVGMQNGKIPKFFLKNNWRPMSVIGIGNSLKQTKTAVYANYSDLIISYTDSQPLIEMRTIWG